MLKEWIGWVARIQSAEAAHHAVGNQLNASPRRNSLQPIERRRLTQPARHFVRNLRPECVFILAEDSAVQNDSPLLLFRRGKPQALEWNRHLNYKAAAGDFAPRIPHRVEGSI